MTRDAKSLPDGEPAVAPYLCVRDTARALDFYRQVFGATETMRIPDPSGKIGHAEIRIGGYLIMMAGEYPEFQTISPESLGGTPVSIHLYVEDVDAIADRAVAAGATLLCPVEDKFYGDRSGKLRDPFGHIWMIATRKENLSAEEIERRAAAHCGGS